MMVTTKQLFKYCSQSSLKLSCIRVRKCVKTDEGLGRNVLKAFFKYFITASIGN